MPLGLLDWAQRITSIASSLTNIVFGVVKAHTKLGFSIARGIASFTQIPLLTTSLNHLENLSLLPILLGESIASTSLNAASTSLNMISSLLENANDEATFSLASFVTLVRLEWAEFEAAGRNITEVARAVAAWAAIQGITRQWSEERLLKDTAELTHQDFQRPNKANGRKEKRRDRRRTISRVSVTDDLMIPEQGSQIISADIGEREDPIPFFDIQSQIDSIAVGKPVQTRSNYEKWKTLRRLSKMVLAGYGGAALLFFGAPLQPDAPKADSKGKSSPSSGPDSPTSQRSFRLGNEVNDFEEDILVHAVENAEAEALSPPMRNIPLPAMLPSKASPSGASLHRSGSVTPTPGHSSPLQPSSFSWWNVLLGNHDRDIFEGFAFTPVDDSDKDTIRSPLSPASTISLSSHGSFFHHPPTLTSAGSTSSLRDLFSHHSAQGSSYSSNSTVRLDKSDKKRGTKSPMAVIGDMRHMPRYWVLTDHGRRQVVLVVRGTMSFNELAADLTCESMLFKPATTSSYADSIAADETQEPWTDPVIMQQSLGDNDFLRVVPLDAGAPEHGEDGVGYYHVHGGMLRLARAMGSPGKPVQVVVSAALSRNRGYELVLCGHSLGAGVATLLALMWADPTTCRTVPPSCLPANRRISVYCFAPPCIVSPALSRLCQNLITSVVYSFDVVSRLSLGSVRDLNRVTLQLCEGQEEESTVSLLQRALKGKLGIGAVFGNTEDEKKWFVEVRQRLETHMSSTHLFPPGRVWWAVRNESLHPSHQASGVGSTGLRLYEVQQVERVFGQIEFKGDMLSSHLPHQYDQMLAELEF